jgi:signal peptidase II
MSESVPDAAGPGNAPDGGGLPPLRGALRSPLAVHSPASWARFLVPAVAGLAADLAVKAWAFPGGVPATGGLAGRNPAEFGSDPTPIIPGVLGFTTTINHGAVFGIGQGKVMLFLAFSLFALGLIVWVFLTSLRRQWVVHLALGLITAGAIGNLYDRAVHHGVRDMFRFYVHWYPYIFNIADVLLCVGVPLLIARWLLVNDAPGGGRGFPVDEQKS